MPLHICRFIMRKIQSIISGAIILLALAQAPAIAQSTCQQKLTNGGSNAEYQQCIADEREQRARQLVDIYRLQVDTQKAQREFFFDQRRRQAELLWKQADFEIERQIDQFEQRIAYARLSLNADDEVKRHTMAINALKQRQTLQSRLKDRALELYTEREQLERVQLEMQFARYELSARGLPVLVFEW
jgi:hypothetical protein